MFATHFLSCIIVGILFRFWKRNDNEKVYYRTSSKSSSNNNVTFSNLGEIISSSIMNSINTVVMIGGFVVLFCVIISIMNTSGLLQLVSNIFTPVFNILHLDPNYIKPIFSGFIELTNGVNQITQIPTKSISTSIIITAFLLGLRRN